MSGDTSLWYRPITAISICFNSVCFLYQVSPPEEILDHFDDIFMPALLQEVRQPMAGDNYIVIVGGKPVLQAAEDLFQNPLDLVADDSAADFLGNRYAQPGRFVSTFRDTLEVIQDRMPAGH